MLINHLYISLFLVYFLIVLIDQFNEVWCCHVGYVVMLVMCSSQLCTA